MQMQGNDPSPGCDVAAAEKKERDGVVLSVLVSSLERAAAGSVLAVGKFVHSGSRRLALASTTLFCATIRWSHRVSFAPASLAPNGKLKCLSFTDFRLRARLVHLE